MGRSRPCTSVWKELLDQGLGHEYVTFPDAGLLLIGCSACNSFVQTGPSQTNLRKTCPRQPASPQAASLWGKMCSTGRHYRSHAVIGAPVQLNIALRLVEDQAAFLDEDSGSEQ